MSLLDPHRMLIAVIYMLIIQQVDGNILYPRIVGGADSYSIHRSGVRKRRIHSPRVMSR